LEAIVRKPESDGEQIPKKKPYQAPALIVYGSIVLLTQLNTMGGAMDNTVVPTGPRFT
jgi:hypothetical protein